MLKPIQQQTVLPAQYKQEYLPPITADTTQIHKLIEQTYSKTVLLPQNNSVNVVNFIETPQGLIKQPGSMNPQMLSQIVGSPAILNNSVNQQSIINQNNVSQSNTQNSINQSVNTQPINNRSTIYRTPFASYNPGKVRPTI